MIIPNSEATGPFFKTEKSHSHMPYLILVTLSLARIQRSLLIGYASSRAMTFFHIGLLYPLQQVARDILNAELFSPFVISHFYTCKQFAFLNSSDTCI